VMELLSKAAEFEKQADDKSLPAFLEDVALVADIDSYQQGEDAVALMTLHSAKGLEFPVVFIVGFEEGIFPGYRAVTGSPKEMEEERRLCYVGITRAKEELYLTRAVTRMQYGQNVSYTASRFLKELPEEALENLNMEKRVEIIPAAKKANFVGRHQVELQPGFGPNSYTAPIPAPKDKPLDFAVGDKVRQMKYGVGTVSAISPAGADYEVTVSFPTAGEKKFMAHLSKLVKVEE